MRIILVLAVAVSLAASGACRDSGGDKDALADATGRLDVVAGLFPLAEVARTVGGEAALVTDLTPAGVEPHDFELKPSDVERIQDADLVIVIGGGFQPAVEKAAGRREGKTLTLLPAGERDPHLWLDPVALRDIVGKVAAALTTLRPKDGDGFAQRADALRVQLTDLDATMRAGLKPCRIRSLVTAHDAFGHLARRYDLEQVGIAGVDPSAEPSPARIEEVVNLVKAKGITTVFTESLVSPNVAEALAREAGVRTAVLDPVEGIQSSDASAGLGYFELMRRNLTALRAALDCS